MVLYIRDKNNKTLVDIEVWVATENENKYVELSSTIDIENYSNFLINNLNKHVKIIHDFSNLSELRGWLWERYFIVGKNDGSQIDDVIDKLKVILKKVCKDYKLNLIFD